MSTDRLHQRLTDDTTISEYTSHPDLVAGLVDSLPGRRDSWGVAMATLLSALADIWRAPTEIYIGSQGWVVPAVRALVTAFDRAGGATGTEQARALADVVTRLGGDPWLLSGLHPTRAHHAQIAAAMGRAWLAPGEKQPRTMQPYGALLVGVDL